ncbi:MAG: DNA polymerase IV [Candidatus Hydrogenedentota bacterium]
MATPRRILHIDMDAFFASVEMVRNPSLVGKPVIIGGDETTARGVVSTASYEARKYGVHSAMPLAEARRRCPHGTYMKGNFADYAAASHAVKAVLDTVSPLVQMASIDEAYVDVTGSQKLFGGDDAIAAHIKQAIRKRTGLPCTIAITPNKLVSKVASDEGKPDGYVCVGPGEERAYLAPLAVKKLPGAGPRTCSVLESLGVMTAGQLAVMPLAALEQVFGAQVAISLQRTARGIASDEVEVEGTPKSISRETTFDRDLVNWEDVERVLAYLTERAAYTLREEGLEAQRVTLKVRYAGFETHTFGKMLSMPTCVDHEIAAALRELLPKAKQRRARVRLIGVNLSALRFNQHQLHLFDRAHAEKWEQVLERMDAVRMKHGFESLRFGKSMGLGKEVKLSNPSLSK